MADNKLAPATQNFLSQLVPTNARVFGSTVLGNTAPITEADLSSEELDVLRSMYESKKKQNESIKQELANRLSVSKKDYDKRPESTVVEFQRPDGSLGYQQQVVPYDQYIKKAAADLQTYEKTKNKTSLGYYDYPDAIAAPTFDKWLDVVKKSYSDPAYRMKTVLGSFNVMDSPEGPTVVDKYNFDKKDFYQSQYGVDFDKDSTIDLWKKANGPIDFLDMLMIKKMPNTSRNVNIKLRK